MIKLETLTVEGFKRLSGIELCFPPRCCVLIEGPNEAGKSTLFESIYYALYGDALVKRGGGRGRITSAIRHGLSEAFVALTMSVGDTQLELQRSVFRGRSNTAQLSVTYSGREPETVSGVRAVNARVIQELNGLDGEALLNSCFVEQKKLDKLEDSSRAKREEVLLKLLDMERLTRLRQAFKWGRNDDHELAVAVGKLEMVQAARELTQARKRITQVERRLRLVAIHIELDEIDRQREIIQRESAEQKRQENEAYQLERELAHLEHLRSADAALVTIRDSLHTIANYRAEIRRLQGELGELDRLEREEVPARRAEVKGLRTLKSHLTEIKGLEASQQQAQAAREKLEGILSLAGQLKEPNQELDALPDQERAARNALKDARSRLKAAQTIESLRRWKSAYRAAETLADADEQIGHAQRQLNGVRQRRQALERERKSSKNIAAAVALFSIGLVAAAASLAFAPIWLPVPLGDGLWFNALWLVAAAFIVAAALVGVRGWKQRRDIVTRLATLEDQLQDCERTLGEQKKRKEVLIEQEPMAVEMCDDDLERLGAHSPESQVEAEAVIAMLEENLGECHLDTLSQVLTTAQSKIEGLAERRKALEAECERIAWKLGRALAEVDLPDVESVEHKVEALRQREAANVTAAEDGWEAIANDLRRLALPQEVDLALGRVAAEIGRLTNSVESLERQIKKREGLKQQQEDWQDNIATEQDKIEEQQEKMAELSQKVRQTVAVPDTDTAPQVLAGVREALSRIDEVQLRRGHKAAQQAAANARAAIQQARRTISSEKESIRQNLDQLELCSPDELTHETIAALAPEFAQLSSADQRELKTQRDDLIGEIRSREQQIERLEAKLQVGYRNLDEGDCKREVRRLEQRRAVCSRAKYITDGVGERMLSQVLPSTVSYMQLILPLLTAGRYHHADLDPANYKMQVWDAQAGERGEYVKKDFFSGGTQDQFSLALRLGFALAALPQELGVSPGFIFLDEPLSAFDRQRTDALIKLLTEGEICKRFDQVFLIAHDRTFETCPFPYYIRLEEGRVADQNLAGPPKSCAC